MIDAARGPVLITPPCIRRVLTDDVPRPSPQNNVSTSLIAAETITAACVRHAVWRKIRYE